MGLMKHDMQLGRGHDRFTNIIFNTYYISVQGERFLGDPTPLNLPSQSSYPLRPRKQMRLNPSSLASPGGYTCCQCYESFLLQNRTGSKSIVRETVNILASSAFPTLNDLAFPLTSLLCHFTQMKTSTFSTTIFS